MSRGTYIIEIDAVLKNRLHFKISDQNKTNRHSNKTIHSEDKDFSLAHSKPTQVQA